MYLRRIPKPIVTLFLIFFCNVDPCRQALIGKDDEYKGYTQLLTQQDVERSSKRVVNTSLAVITYFSIKKEKKKKDRC